VGSPAAVIAPFKGTLKIWVMTIVATVSTRAASNYLRMGR